MVIDSHRPTLELQMSASVGSMKILSLSHKNGLFSASILQNLVSKLYGRTLKVKAQIGQSLSYHRPSPFFAIRCASEGRKIVRQESACIAVEKTQLGPDKGRKVTSEFTS